MSVPYNPFELLNLSFLKDILRKQSYFLVVQRLYWPGIPDKKGFIATPYQNEQLAKAHAKKLDSKEGRLIDLQSEKDKIFELIESPKYLLFLNTCRDADWESKILKHYEKNIELNLKTLILIQPEQKVDIELTFEQGILKAIIQTQESVQEFSLHDLIK